MHVAVFKKNDKRTIYNVIYRDGKKGAYMMKRFFVTSITRDREYDVTQGTAGSKVIYFTSNANGEAEVVHITLKPSEKIKKLTFDINFADLAIKGRVSKGNIVTKNTIYRINLKSHGVSTLGGREVWFDNAVRRLNYDERGQLLGEFGGTDRVLVILKNGEYYTTDTDINNHYEDNIAYIGKYDGSMVWTAVYSCADTDGRPYIKRFQLESSVKRQNFLSDQGDARMLLLTSEAYPRICITFGGGSNFREPQEVDVDEFIAVKGVKARGKRLTNYEVAAIEELEPLRQPEPTVDEEEDTENEAPYPTKGDKTDDEAPDGGEPDEDESEPTTEKTDDEIRDELNGQLRLF
jgi:topoisomerase-4 subunit A